MSRATGTRGDIQLPESAFANVCAYDYLTGKQTSQRIGTATEYTSNVLSHETHSKLYVYHSNCFKGT